LERNGGLKGEGDCILGSCGFGGKKRLSPLKKGIWGEKKGSKPWGGRMNPFFWETQRGLNISFKGAGGFFKKKRGLGKRANPKIKTPKNHRIGPPG